MDRRTKCPSSAWLGGVFVHGSQLQASENAYDFCAPEYMMQNQCFVICLTGRKVLVWEECRVSLKQKSGFRSHSWVV